MIKKIICAVLCMCMVISAGAIGVYASYEPRTDAGLKFNDDGKFKIMQLADIQDFLTVRPITKQYIKDLLEREKPDLVVLTGDNISSSSLTIGSAATGIVTLMSIFQKYGVKVAAVFGNHDDETTLATKDIQMNTYCMFKNFVGCAGEKDIAGVGNYNVPILSSDGTKIAFNLWCMDSLTYNDENDLEGYGCVHKDQIEWYKQVSNALKAQNGGEAVPSIAFQHIIVPEIWDALDVVEAGTEGSVEHDGKYYALPDSAAEDSVLNETCCPPRYSNGQFDAMVEQGDVLAMAFGHDHVNSFVVPYKGVDLVNTAGVGFNSYGDENRGARIFVLDENNTSDYETYTIKYSDIYTSDAALYRFILNGSEYSAKEQFIALINYIRCLFRDRLG